jgi:arylsulfatase A-like enzyme
MRLAEESTVFRQCFSTAPTCSPSRAGLLTGMAPHCAGMLGLAHRGFHLNDPGHHIVSLLKKAGYETVLSGIQHEAPRGPDLLYDKIISSVPTEMEHFHDIDSIVYDTANARKAADYLLKAEKPFFLSLGLFNTHRQFPKPAHPEKARYVRPPSPVPDNSENREDMLAFRESARIADDCAGTVLEALRRSGHEKDTIVLFTTDHGIAFPRMKCTLYDTGIGVACMLKYPGNLLAGQTSDAMISHLDILPTLFDLLGLPHETQFQGTSLLPLLEGKTGEVRDRIFAEINFHAAYEPLRCVRTARYKYIRRFDETYRLPVPSNMDDCPSKTRLIESGFLEKEVPVEEFYDLNLDPGEKINLAPDPSYAQRIEENRRMLWDWMRDTGDPLLAGPVPLPKGAVANKRTCISPSTRDFDAGA